MRLWVGRGRRERREEKEEREPRSATFHLLMQSEGRLADSPRCPSAELRKGSISEGGDRRGQRPPVRVPQLCLLTGTNVSRLPTCPNLDDPNPPLHIRSKKASLGPQAPSFLPQFGLGLPNPCLLGSALCTQALCPAHHCPDSLDEAHFSEAVPSKLWTH